MTEEANNQSLEAVIVQLDNGSILLPRSAFLEVSTRPGGANTDRQNDSRGCMEPDFTWQDLDIPVVNVSRLLDPDQAEGTVGKRNRFTRLLVMQSIANTESLPFYALEVKGTPHPVQITPQNIQGLGEADSTPWSWRVRASGVTSHLLRLDAIEEHILATAG
ncbi:MULTISPECIES: hypothetical protein [unclassified Thioalkalivibrio]|uniref:hypothetical protein n=1 Tax=unclassified Thioalkalivibrio TaxID=2621013 RepID=UPI000373D066|nr:MULTISPECIES: hypothetical protein [unclassified Thioalkalivibrio]